MSDAKLPPLPEDDNIVHIYPWDLERMASTETTTTVFSVAVGCPDGESVPLYTAEQMRQYAIAAQLAAAAQSEKKEGAVKPSDDEKLWELFWENDSASFDQGTTEASKKEREAFFAYLDAHYTAIQPVQSERQPKGILPGQVKNWSACSVCFGSGTDVAGEPCPISACHRK